MKTKQEIAEDIGVTRQMLHGVVTGRYNCGYGTAKEFDRVLGGGVEVWVYKKHTTKRMSLLERYRGIS
jgi:plasmid maintenance system antidote protein VapI